MGMGWIQSLKTLSNLGLYRLNQNGAGMRTKLLAGMAIFGLFSTLTAAAVPSAVVDAVQAPVWVERAERRLPLAPGMQLENRDRLLTGRGARAVVKLADGSTVKFGENVNVAVNAMKQGKKGFFTAALDVSKGAFRLTTDIFRQRQNARLINIRAGTVTMGIRGTDVWGRSGDEKDIVCLFEGHVIASHPQAEPVELTEPLQYYAATKGQAPEAVASVDRVQLAKWALETELQYGLVTQQSGGRWALDFGRFDKDGELTLHDQLSAAGYAGRIRPVQVSGGYLYDLRLEKLLTEGDAQSLADKLVRDLQVAAPAIRRH
jgi:hypothetical protein